MRCARVEGAARISLLLALGLLAACERAPQTAPHTVYVSDEQANVLHVIDGATAKKVATIATGQRPRGMGLSPDGAILYVAASNDNRIERVALATRKVVGSLASGSDPEQFAVSPQGSMIYVANEDVA